MSCCNKDKVGRLVGEKSPTWRGGMRHQKYTQYLTAAQKRNYGFDLTKEEFNGFWQKPCHYCGGAIETIGLDRVDSTMGYSIDNVVPCCSVCNRMKTDHTVEEFLEHVQKIYKMMILDLKATILRAA